MRGTGHFEFIHLVSSPVSGKTLSECGEQMKGGDPYALSLESDDLTYV